MHAHLQALDCLNNCKGNDQVCSYRCITSHETAAFEKFAMCILQKNNCMGNTATMPVYPDPEPMTTFRGAPLSFEDAENIFIGKLKLREGESNYLVVGTELLPWSWKVIVGLTILEVYVLHFWNANIVVSTRLYAARTQHTTISPANTNSFTGTVSDRRSSGMTPSLRSPPYTEKMYGGVGIIVSAGSNPELFITTTTIEALLLLTLPGRSSQASSTSLWWITGS